MVATAKVDLYLLKGDDTTDDYSSRRLACSEAELLSPIEHRKRWLQPKSFDFKLGLKNARLTSGLILPNRHYRIEMTDGKATVTLYGKLQHYQYIDEALVLTFL